MPFPENATGFLYYWQAPRGPAISGGLRFRVTPSNTRPVFNELVDLEISPGQPWHIPLYTLVRSKCYAAVALQLLSEGLVDENLVSDIRKLPKARLDASTTALYTINDPFHIDLQNSRQKMFAVTRHNLAKGSIRYNFTDKRDNVQGHPFRGTVVARFERSTFPEHANTRTLVLRILQLLTPVECVVPGYDNYIAQPEVGKLLCRQSRWSADYQPWTVDCDNSTSGGGILKILL
ncbi:hypothetical protein B0H34DRAFT_661521 [Crassisporium funariophilum]|nr:hypothetical protein B0H34DRAFT_661521 [Crassisporium funariophilum]